MSSESPPKPVEVLLTDQNYLVREYRIILQILEAVKLGFTPREDLDAAVDSFIEYKLPAKYRGRIASRIQLEDKYMKPHMGDFVFIEQHYHTQNDRRRERCKIENDIKWNAVLDNISQIKDLLETEKIMNVFDNRNKETYSPLG